MKPDIMYVEETSEADEDYASVDGVEEAGEGRTGFQRRRYIPHLQITMVNVRRINMVYGSHGQVSEEETPRVQ